MSDYAAVGPTDSNKYDTSSAFADALQRARQIAAKINPSAADPGHGAKRQHEEMDHLEDGPDKKKIAAVNDPFGAQLAAMHQQRAATATAVAPSSTGNPSFNAMIVENWKVPDKMVGLNQDLFSVIGRGGEQIGRLQTESGCKIQMAADSGGHPDRTCTLSGSRVCIEKAKDLINQIINRGGPNIPAVPEQGHLPEGHSMVEILIPGGKVGLVIGKGGETIRNLQERAGVKMVMIQDGPQQTHNEKPLRISGEPQKCEFAKQMIMDLITEKELESVQRSWPQHTNDYGSGGVTTQEVMVPRQAVGVVIGKQGEMIKRIQQETGAKVQFQNNNDDSSNERVCTVTGSPDQCAKAASFITDLIQSVLEFSCQTRDQQIGRGRGRGRSFDNQNGFGGGGGGGGRGGGDGGGGGRGPGRDMQELQYSVPANKCGLVIGKGGETIRNINQQSGAHVELSRDPPPSHHEKVFVIRGNPQQVEIAQQLINERVGGGPMGDVRSPQGSQGGQGYNNQYSYQQPPQGPQPGQGYNGQNWNNNYHYPQTSSQNDTSADANAAAWAAYYAQMYNQQQPGQGPQPGQPQAAPSQQPTQPGGGAPMGGAGAVPGAPGGAAAGAAGAQPDYSAAWAEYYRSLGMFREAEMIEQQARANQQAQATQVSSPYGQPAQQPYQAAGGPPTAGGGPAPPGAAGGPQPGAAPPGQQAPPPGGGPAGAPGGAVPPPQAAGAAHYGAPGAAAGGAPPAAQGGAPQWGGAPGYPQQQPQAAYGQPQQYPGYNYSAYGQPQQ